MRADQKNEALALYLGFFVTLAFILIPSISYYALGALVLEAFYAFIRYMSTNEPVFRSHLFNYLLGVGVSFIVFLVLTIQAQAFGFELLKALTCAATGSGYKYDSAVPFGVAAVVMGIEGLFAIVWPIVLISRGLYLINTGGPVSSGFRAAPAGAAGLPKTALFARTEASARSAGGCLLSAVLADGRVLRYQVENQTSKSIGRDTDSDFLLDDPTVSRRHAVIEVREGVAYLKDVGSQNGTKASGRPVGFNAVPLRPSDTFEIGSVKVTISAL